MPVQVRLFAALRELLGTDHLSVEPDEGETVAQLFARLFPDEPEERWAGTLMYAVNRAYVGGDHALQDGDEVAFIPPLGGGSADPRVELCSEPLDLAALIAQVEGPGRGGVCTFTGTVRDHFEGRPVRQLAYEAYEEMAGAQMSALCDEIEARWPGVAVAMAHRVGILAIGEAAVCIAAAGPHRAEAFEACRHGIDALKDRVPIFKQEIYDDGSEWKRNR